ncbi:MAG: VrrB protein [Proteobacteria bacterium]|nr:VrrB protein [Pseudomonadota bacterium]
MRKLVMSLSVLAGLLLAGAAPASANAAAGLTAMQVQVDKSPGLVTKARWHRGWGHRGWGWRHHRRWGRGIYFGFGWPYYYGYYPRHRYYYDDDDYYYGGPYYGYYGGYRHRHWRHHGWGHRGWYGHRGWGGRHHGWGHGGHRGHGGHHRH